MTQATQRAIGDRMNFLEYRDESGFLRDDAPMGYRSLRHRVTVFNADKQPMVVSLSIDAGGMSMHESLSPDEARTLALALLKAADYAESANEARLLASTGVAA